MALAAGAYYFTPTVLKNEPPIQPPPRQELPKESTLKLRLEERGENFSKKDAPYEGFGRQVVFTLSNPLSGLAVIDAVSLEVFDVIPDKFAVSEAVMVPFKYEASLGPNQRGLVPVVKNTFKYSPNEIDRFVLKVTSTATGFDYIVRVVVAWHDEIADAKRTAVSDVIALKFPSFPDEKLKLNEIGRLSEIHDEKLMERVKEIRSKLSQTGEQ